MVFRNQLIAGGGHIVVLMKFAYGGFLEWGYPKMDGLIWGYPHFGKPRYIFTK